MAEKTRDNFSESKASPVGWAAVFAALLGEQRELLVALDEWSRRQRVLILGDAPEELDALMDERQRIVDRLEMLITRMTPMQTRWAEAHGDVPSALRSEIETNLQCVAALARGIAQRDTEDQELLARRKREVAEAIASMAGNQRAMHAYAGGSPGNPSATPVFQDREA